MYIRKLGWLVLFLISMRCWSVEVDKKKWGPDFLIVGAQKAGTTALFTYINAHPKVVNHTGEIHFFDLNFDQGTKWYKNQFPERPKSDYLIGDKSPYYLFHPSVPERVFSLYPNIKIIILLRNPIDRAYSQYWMNIRYETETLSFEEAINAEPKRLAGETEKLLLNPGYCSDQHKRFSYLSRGIYVDQIKRWMSFFPSEKILILLSDDLKNNPTHVMNKVFSFLELPNYDKIRFTSKNKGKYPPMDAQTKKQLSKYFHPFNQQLEEFLGIDLNWD